MKRFLFMVVLTLTIWMPRTQGAAASLSVFNPIVIKEVEYKFHGICICPKGPFVEVGIVQSYYVPQFLMETTRVPGVSVLPWSAAIAAMGKKTGIVGGTHNTVNDANLITNNCHISGNPYQRIILLMGGVWNRCDWYGKNSFSLHYVSEIDPMWRFPRDDLRNPYGMLQVTVASVLGGCHLLTSWLPICAGMHGNRFPRDQSHTATDPVTTSMVTCAKGLSLLDMSFFQVPTRPVYGRMNAMFFQVPTDKIQLLWPSPAPAKKLIGLNLQSALYNKIAAAAAKSAGQGVGINQVLGWIYWRRTYCCTCW